MLPPPAATSWTCCSPATAPRAWPPTSQTTWPPCSTPCAELSNTKQAGLPPPVLSWPLLLASHASELAVPFSSLTKHPSIQKHSVQCTCSSVLLCVFALQKRLPPALRSDLSLPAPAASSWALRRPFIQPLFFSSALCPTIIAIPSVTCDGCKADMRSCNNQGGGGRG